MEPRPTKEVVVVTGASRGIGSGIAKRLFELGYSLGLCARHLPEHPGGRSENLDSSTPTVVRSAVDVTDFDALEEFSADVIEVCGRIDVWINNAGILEPIGPLADSDPLNLLRHVEVNVGGVLLGSRIFARHVRSRSGGGVLVNITSGAARSPYRGWAPYCASKAAVDMITEVVALEEGGSGLTAFALAPGVVDTSMQELIRSTDASRFPQVERFREIASSGRFNSTKWIADHIVELLNVSGADSPVRVRVPDEHVEPTKN